MTDTAARNRIGAGRVLAMKKFPYYSRILSVMVVCERPGLGKFTADSRWRLYYDPEKVMEWTLEEVAAAWVHCVEHIFRQHAQRFNSLEDARKDPELFQQCADVAINEDLKQNGVLMPELESQHYFDREQHPEWTKGMGAEEMYFAAKAAGSGNGSESSDASQGGSENDESPDTQKDDTEGSQSQQGPDESTSDADGDEQKQEDDKEKSRPEQDQSQEESQSQSKDPKQKSESEESEKDASDGESGAGEDSSDESSEESDGSGDAQDGEGESEGETESGEGSSGGGDGSTDASADDSADSSEGDAGGHSEQSDCGSSVDNIRRDYEERSNNDGSMNSVAAENIKQDVAKDIINFANSRPGSVPSSLVREASSILKPQVDWRKDLMMEVRRGISKKAGQADRSYKKAARRSLHPKIIMPGRVAPPVPRIAVILDTSGSMDEAVELSIALAEIDNLLKSVAKESESQSLTIINCDAGANVPVVVRKLSDYEMVGGGGTDMRVGIERAAEMKPLFDIIMTITDGYTPWPQQPPQKNRMAKYIACIVGKDTRRASRTVPAWMTTIEVNMPNKRPKPNLR